MIIIDKLKAAAKAVLNALLTAFKAVVLFFTEVKPQKRQGLSNMDIAEIFIALLPAAIFGAVAFGLKALIILGLSVAVCTLLALLWDIIFKRKNITIDLKSALTGFVLALTLTSTLDWRFTLAISAAAVLLGKIFYRNDGLAFTSPVLIAKTLFLIIFFRVFTAYALPVENIATELTPLNYMFGDDSLSFSAKHLFFGLHSGNIGEISDFLLVVGGIYLMLRRIINPVICSFYIGTSALLSYLFKESLPLSLLGGGLFFAAIFLTMDYSFRATPLYKKILYGITCGLLTFIIRLIFKAEGAVLAVLICNLGFTYVNIRNIKRGIRFCKKPDFKRLLVKIKGKIIY